MAARELKNIEPPEEGYRQVGWHCVYHEAQGRSCHNPLDCDMVPIWALTWEAAHKIGFK